MKVEEAPVPQDKLDEVVSTIEGSEKVDEKSFDVAMLTDIVDPVENAV